MKPQNLSKVKTNPINIGLTVITNLEIDLTHINYGLDKSKKTYNKKARSKFTELEIAQIFHQLDGFYLNPTGKLDNYLYFSLEINFNHDAYFLVFCIDKNNQDTAGIITLYRV